MDDPAPLSRYELVEEFAAGGMASVHLGRMVGKAGFERVVAIKRLHTHLLSDPDFVAMFLDEARLAAKIRHPNVVDVYDVSTENHDLLIVMEYVEGTTLDTVVKELRSAAREVPVGFSLRVIHDALLGLHAAHQLVDELGAPLGLIHRDVSPQNLLIGTDGITRVADFGVAKAAGRLASTKDNVVKGKLSYMAPEQLQSTPMDHRADIFAAGIVLWECLTQKRLFHGPTMQETVPLIMSHPIEPPSTHRLNISLALDEVCLRALERDPARRFATAADFAEALEQAAGPKFFRPREVGALISELVGDVLKHRREVLRGLPRSSRSFDSMTLSQELFASPSDRATAEKERRAPRRPLSWLNKPSVLLGLLLAGVVGALGWMWTREAPADTQASAARAGSPSAAPSPATAAPLPGEAAPRASQATAAAAASPGAAPESPSAAASAKGAPSPHSASAAPAARPKEKRQQPYVPQDL